MPPPPPASRCGPHFPACTMILGQLTGAAWERRGQPSLECLSPPQPRWCHADRRHLHRALKRGADPSRPQKLLFRFPKGRPTSKAPPPASPRLSGQPQRRTKHRALPPAGVRAEPCQRDSVARSIAPGAQPCSQATCAARSTHPPGRGHLKHCLVLSPALPSPVTAARSTLPSPALLGIWTCCPQHCHLLPFPPAWCQGRSHIVPRLVLGFVSKRYRCQELPARSCSPAVFTAGPRARRGWWPWQGTSPPRHCHAAPRPSSSIPWQVPVLTRARCPASR